ncbi:hypothetical protein HBI56_022990 [Parastagonospora nodorum]|uniref:Uncharacterized protein n=1 Tax=Phaeosphaeria nodorum (strain SN15 / ATCC MYA-4574 / FGSC 10173) TaxID=321614 RepID=A0A7U2I0L2_PHANO|nr:hypothetical protein HBH56_025520 [Parastagonospora nodorum]QRC98880.1 hypothetical protein JI435_062420 [Parastagonospora nodorum SN15]KAH3934087.1 hypothetical protein HBH54_056490 [Parastagonospora nodorum]KAH3949706.1 hypothetical protein HBH53_084180 [Parastagonospora nodorum]KAH3976083.1 hypothetical protein HBH51_081170 [Parastagonospora nodorum]
MHISGVMQGSTSPAFTSLRVDMAANSGNVMVPWQVLWLLGGIVQVMHRSHLSSAATTFSFTGAQGTPMLPARPAYVPWVSLVDPLFLLTCLFICLSSSAVATHVSRLQITPTIVSRVENTARPTL